MYKDIFAPSWYYEPPEYYDAENDLAIFEEAEEQCYDSQKNGDFND